MNWSAKLIWKIEWDERARKEFRKLDPSVQKEILLYLRERIEGAENPHTFGESLSGNKAGLWRYRVRDYRIICKIEEHHWVILVIGVGHRREVYDE